jgi:hypothetical protein
MPPELLEIIKAGGAALAPFLGFLWWLERSERLKEREGHKTVAQDMITAMVKTENALATLLDLFPTRNG